MMKKFTNKLKWIAIVLLNLGFLIVIFMGNSACEARADLYDYDFFPLDKTTNIAMYFDEVDFKKQYDAHNLIESSEDDERIYMVRKDYHGESFSHDLYVYVDAYDVNGYSTWGNPFYKIEFSEPISAEKLVGLVEEEGTNYDYHNIRFTEELRYETPPEHRMLVLNSMDDLSYISPGSGVPDKFIEPRSKTWRVESIYATNSAGELEVVTPEWDMWNYSDNRYTFCKADRVGINPGSNLSEEEEEYFEGATLVNHNYYGTYSVIEADGDKKIRISIANAAINEEFIINSGGWNLMELSFDRFNETVGYSQHVILTIVPDN